MNVVDTTIGAVSTNETQQYRRWRLHHEQDINLDHRRAVVLAYRAGDKKISQLPTPSEIN